MHGQVVRDLTHTAIHVTNTVAKARDSSQCTA